MSRAVFLATAGDPFTTSLVFRLFKTRWYDEADTFYINYNNHCNVPPDVVAEFLSVMSREPKAHLIYHPKGIGNGPPIAEMVHICQQDHILLLEEDGYIFNPGIVNMWFQQIESDLIDAVGSPRFSCGPEIGIASQRKYGLNYGAYGDVGPNFWPNFFFCKKSDLLRTDMDFGSHTWQAGEYCPKLDHTFEQINHGDTFVWMCVQLRALGLRFASTSQHHADPYEVEHMKTKEANWHRLTKPFDWIHAGSLSAGWGGYLSGRVPDVSAEISKLEIETRCAFWKICADVTEGYKDFKQEYLEGIDKLVENAQLSWNRIDEKIAIYRSLMRI